VKLRMPVPSPRSGAGTPASRRAGQTRTPRDMQSISFKRAAIIQTLHAIVIRQTLARGGCELSCVRRLNLMSCEPAATWLNAEEARSRVQQRAWRSPASPTPPGWRGQAKVGPLCSSAGVWQSEPSAHAPCRRQSDRASHALTSPVSCACRPFPVLLSFRSRVALQGGDRRLRQTSARRCPHRFRWHE
jgi:hypothetical protein